ncbi:ABC transporter substrate-binding protein [Frankia sp. Cppng1_Ct_nod]|uniref:ABC transporter substrate-binding protein n=1 Tax=Frankia sp. Cppng1_Ct_nod TaxID=2897162 RepID=UPI0010411AB8|nr:ABC transporter substrate-binding protein [Frankia sp. Cppng1_Ct_nod]
MIPLGRRGTASLLVAGALVVGGAGCGTGSTPENDAAAATHEAGGKIKTSAGISGSVLTLGVLTDLSGVFKGLAKDLTDAQQLYWDQKNATGGVCNRYSVVLDVRDHGYNTDRAVEIYSGMKGKVLAIEQLLGSPMATKLGPSIDSDQIVTMAETWAPALTDNRYYMIVGATYDIQMINGIDYLIQQHKIKDGGAIGHIYHNSELGMSALLGSTYMAKRHGLGLVEQKIDPNQADMTAAVTALAAKKVTAILFTGTPAQTAAVASTASKVGLDVPILASNVSFAPSLLTGPAGPALKKNLYLVLPSVGFSEAGAREVHDAFLATHVQQSPTLGVVDGWSEAVVMDQLLEKACSNGDLTREGLLAAKNSLTRVETGGLTPPLDYSQLGTSPTKASYVGRAADVPGGITVVGDLIESSDVGLYNRSR